VGCSDAELLEEQLVLEWGIQRGGRSYVLDHEHEESKEQLLQKWWSSHARETSAYEPWRQEVSGDKVKEIEERIADLKARWPAHSVPPSMWQQLEELEVELEKARSEINENSPRSQRRD